MLRWLPFLAVMAICIGLPVSPQQGDTLWLMWERPGQDCWRGNCTQPRQLTSHFLTDLPTDTAQALFSRMAPLAAASGSANIVHGELPFCENQPAAPAPPMMVAAPTSVDVTGWEPVSAVATLKDLVGFHADFRGLRGPPGYSGDFGAEAHTFLTQMVTEAGIPLLTKEEVLEAPGQPILKLAFSVEVRGCKPWSVSLSLSQTLLLSRDLTKMLTGTTWSSSARQDEANVEFQPNNAVEEVIIAFIEAWKTANDPKPLEETAAAQ